ncbi:MAG: methylamine utilization protein [Pseudomonadota bacterium]
MSRRLISQSFWTLLLIMAAAAVSADTLTVEVQDRKGRPVPDVVVFVKAEGLTVPDAGATATMDQLDGAFAPHILVVAVGTAVAFPNSDTVAHHVYSFSRPNNFVLPLYRGDEPPPKRFDHEGIATIGCNIHDNMLGYIAVVDSPLFGKTDQDGLVTLQHERLADAGDVYIWSPRIRGEGGYRMRSVAGEAQVTFKLAKRLRAAHDPGESSFIDY